MPKIYYQTDGMPVYRKQDGWRDQDEWQTAVLNDLTKKPSENQPQSGTTLGRAAVNLLPGMGAIAGAAIPIAGETGLPEISGAALGTAAKQYLRSRFPEQLGSNPTGIANVADEATDVIGGGVLPVGAKMAMKGLSPAAQIASKFIGSRFSNLTNAISRMEPSPANQQLIGDILRAIMPTIKSQ